VISASLVSLPPGRLPRRRVVLSVDSVTPSIMRQPVKFFNKA